VKRQCEVEACMADGGSSSSCVAKQIEVRNVKTFPDNSSGSSPSNLAGRQDA
jgi:hypothetical protein